MSKVTVIDYGASNLLNVVRALEHCGAEVFVTNDAAAIRDASRLILPGVGAFGDCSKALHTLRIDQPIRHYVESGRPFLGICVGMQIMFDSGEEFGTHPGLGIVPGRVSRIPDSNAQGKLHKIPHIGWNVLRKPAASPAWEHTILEPLTDKPEGASVYFVHSFRGIPADPSHCLANVDYNGVDICAVVRRGNAYGCQFHPEKSGQDGLNLLKCFLSIQSG